MYEGILLFAFTVFSFVLILFLIVIFFFGLILTLSFWIGIDMDIVRPNYAFDPTLLPSPCETSREFLFALPPLLFHCALLMEVLQPCSAASVSIASFSFRISWQRRGGKRFWGNGIVHNLCHVSVLICTLFVVLYYCTQ